MLTPSALTTQATDTLQNGAAQMCVELDFIHMRGIEHLCMYALRRCCQALRPTASGRAPCLRSVTTGLAEVSKVDELCRMQHVRWLVR